MGCCNSVNRDERKSKGLSNVARPATPDRNNRIQFDEEDIRTSWRALTSAGNHEVASDTTKVCRRNSRSSVKQLVLEVMDVLRILTENEEDAPPCLMKLHDIAEKENGWLDMVMSCIEVIPLESDLGPAVISLLLDECSLAPKETLYILLQNLGLADKAPKNIDLLNSNSSLRNAAIVLGSLADKLAGPQSVWLMTEGVLKFLLNKLTVKGHPSVVLFSIITLEKFAKTIENKDTIKSSKVAEYLSVIEDDWVGSGNVLEHQAGFCAQWCLDNTFPLEGRSYSYEKTNLEGINAMLNVNDVSTYLKISPNGLEARSDACSFESVRSTYSVKSGRWFYEVILLTSGVMQIGWATRESKFLSHEGYGIGDDSFSIAFDGCRQLIWFEAESKPVSCSRWKPDDVLGMLLDIDEDKVVFYLNGVPIEKQFPAKGRGAFFAAASFMSFQQCKFNFGAEQFKFPPNCVSFNTFNDHAQMSDEEKKVLPRHIKMTELKHENFHADSCTICYERIANAILAPCGHGNLCLSCANQLEDCPLCRRKITGVKKELITEV